MKFNLNIHEIVKKKYLFKGQTSPENRTKLIKKQKFLSVLSIESNLKKFLLELIIHEIY